MVSRLSRTELESLLEGMLTAAAATDVEAALLTGAITTEQEQQVFEPV